VPAVEVVMGTPLYSRISMKPVPFVILQSLILVACTQEVFAVILFLFAYPFFRSENTVCLRSLGFWEFVVG
jgi:hypothetical protein